MNFGTFTSSDHTVYQSTFLRISSKLLRKAHITKLKNYSSKFKKESYYFKNSPLLKYLIKNTEPGNQVQCFN